MENLIFCNRNGLLTLVFDVFVFHNTSFDASYSRKRIFESVRRSVLGIEFLEMKLHLDWLSKFFALGCILFVRTYQAISIDAECLTICVS